jgi:hypothetical protein
VISHTAALKFSDSQKRLLRSTYDAAWSQGVASYQPDPDPEQEPQTPRDVALAGLTGAALLAARKAYSYVAPVSPDPLRRAVALSPAFSGLNRMTAEIITLPVDMAATAAEGAAQIGFAEAVQNALKDWVEANAYRLDNGDSVSYAGSEAGYAEAADADGQLMEWNDSGGDDRECEDCISLAGMPPMPLGDWPSQPGDGSTSCSVGCRCEMGVSDVSVSPGDIYAPDLTDAQQLTVSGLMDAQQAALGAMMIDAQYLD